MDYVWHVPSVTSCTILWLSAGICNIEIYLIVLPSSCANMLGLRTAAESPVCSVTVMPACLQVAFDTCSVLTAGTGEAYGLVWTPKPDQPKPAALRMTVVPVGPSRPDCFWYKVRAREQCSKGCLTGKRVQYSIVQD